MKDYKQNRRVITGGSTFSAGGALHPCCKLPSEGDSNGNLTDKSKQYIKHLEKLLGMSQRSRMNE